MRFHVRLGYELGKCGVHQGRLVNFGSPVPVPHKPTAFTPNGSNSGTSKGSFASVLNEDNPLHVPSATSKPALVLDDSCIKDFDFSLSLMGKFKEVYAIPNLYIILSNEDFHNLKITYLGGLWVLLEMDSIASKEMFLKHTGVGSWFTNIKQAINSFECDERIVWVTIEGLSINAWVSESSFMHNDDLDKPKSTNSNIGGDGTHSEDPFKIYDILKGQQNNESNSSTVEPKFPPRFTPLDNDEELNIEDILHAANEQVQSLSSNFKVEKTKGRVSSLNSTNSSSLKFNTRGSILEVMDELVKVGQTKDYNMEGYAKNIEAIIGSQGDFDVFK
nr:RNA-directed DNA polymerase, eukaryota, nucleotide-binding alpha-beta plait domain protein [Tanacetum cinerariifolium]